jgi:membrane fusion protein (multidrug efflux system)
VSFLDGRANEPTTAAVRPAVRVPSEAIMKEGETTFVWRVSDDSVERVAVRTGGERNGQTEVLSGINAGDVLVGRPVNGLAEGAPVKKKQE